MIGGSQHNTMSSTKPLLRSASPRDGADEKDPDVIPAKFGLQSSFVLQRITFICHRFTGKGGYKAC